MPRTASLPGATDGPASSDLRFARVAATFSDVEFTDPGEGRGATLRGHAAVFDRLSHDLGGFRTRISRGAFDRALDDNPDVHLLWDHDTRYTLARTANHTLELRTDPYGLHVFARLAATSYAQDLATLMRRGDVDQMSFACLIGEDTWTEDDDGQVIRDIQSVAELYDVTVCAQAAFPQTAAGLLAAARTAGRLTPPSPDLTDAQALRVAQASRRARARSACHTHPLPQETATP